MRLDYTLTGFKGFQITRGNVSFVFTGDAQGAAAVMVVMMMMMMTLFLQKAKLFLQP